jgi:hypothetical protein
MLDQLFSINSGSWEGRVIVSRLNIETWLIGKGALKGGVDGKGGCVGRRGMGAARVCGPCVCLSVFLLL